MRQKSTVAMRKYWREQKRKERKKEEKSNEASDKVVNFLHETCKGKDPFVD
jgi:hypothetical protein